MMFPVSILPILAILLLGFSFSVTIQVIRQNEGNGYWISLVINGILLIALLGIFVYGISANDFTFVTPWVYWVLIVTGILTGVISFIKKAVPEQIMSAGLLLFMAFITLFSIGMILFFLFIIQIVFAIVNWKRRGLKITI